MSDVMDYDEVVEEDDKSIVFEEDAGAEVILTHAFQPEAEVATLLSDAPTVVSPTVIAFCVTIQSGCRTIHVHAPSLELLRLVTRHPNEVGVESAVVVVDVPGEKPDAEYSALVAGLPRVSHAALLAASLQKKGDDRADKGNDDREKTLRNGLPEEGKGDSMDREKGKTRSRAASRALAELQTQPEFGTDDDLKA